MCETSLSLWFVCRLCRGSFGQVDAFIEHKKQKHFTQFQNTTCIVFEERELGLQYPVITRGDQQLADESNERQIKIEATDDNPINAFSSEIIGEPNLGLFELKSELITFKSEVNSDKENSFFESNQPEQNSCVLLKQLTSDEIKSASVLNHHSTRSVCGQKNVLNDSKSPNSFASYSKSIGHHEAEKHTENQPSATVTNISTKDDVQLECKLCSKQLESDAELKIHVGICALYHEDRNRFCVTCNRKFSQANYSKFHRLRIHGTEDEKSSLYKFKCHFCPMQYQRAIHLRFHLKSHKELKEGVETSNSKFPKCSHPNCGREFRCNSDLRTHMAIHSDFRPFSCSFPNCNKSFRRRAHLNSHFLHHSGERPYKCAVINCNKTFVLSSDRIRHYRTTHSN